VQTDKVVLGLPLFFWGNQVQPNPHFGEKLNNSQPLNRKEMRKPDHKKAKTAAGTTV
jgi:hypothetical protein